MDNLTILKNRLSKIGIEVEIDGNIPWLYLRSVNGKRVTEKYLANHGFTIAFVSSKYVPGKKPEINLTDTKEIFKIIRKYVNNKE